MAAATQGWSPRNDWLVGYKSVDDLDYVTRDAKRTVNLVAIDPTAQRRSTLNGLKQPICRDALRFRADEAGFGRLQVRVEGDARSSFARRRCDSRGGPRRDPLPTDKPGNFALV